MIQAIAPNPNFQFAEAELLRSRLPQSLHRLADLAYNYWWSWQPEAVSLFESIDPTGWEQCAHNPVMFLDGLSYDRLTQVTCDPQYMATLKRVVIQFDRYLTGDNTWVKNNLNQDLSAAHPIAYFCAEFGIHESLPVYSGDRKSVV